MHTLQIIRGNDTGTQYDLNEDEILLGRASSCGIVLTDEVASRKHARLTQEDDSCFLEDLHSRNHTFVNGKAIAERVRLIHEDRIRIGGTLLVFRSELPDAVPDSSSGMEILRSVDARRSLQAFNQVNAESKLRAILQITQMLGRSLELHTVLDEMLEALFAIFPQADRGLVLLDDGKHLVPRAAKYRRSEEDGIQYSKTVIEQTIRDQRAVLSKNVTTDERFAQTQSLSDLRVRSIVCAPLLAQEGRALGVIQLDTRSQHTGFDEEAADILASVANQAAISVEYAQLHRQIVKQARLQKEMDFARQVQHRFLPTETPHVAGYSFWAHYAAAGDVGGDYYDFVPLPDGRQAAMLGDVSGKGVPAALMMAKLSSVGKVALLRHPDSVVDAMRDMNNDVCDASVDCSFVTLLLCVVDPRAHEITIANAGHMSPMLRRTDGTVDEPAGTNIRGYPLGVQCDHTYKTIQMGLQPGESLVLFSDGISEATDARGEMYSMERLVQRITQTSGTTASEIGDAIIEDVESFVGDAEQADDISLVVISRNALGMESSPSER